MDAGMQIGQTFTAGRSGLLDTVTLYMQRFGGGVGDVTFRIESVSGGGVPNDGDVLAQVTEPASALGDIRAPFNSITFPAPANVVAGQRYAFVVGRTAARQFNYQLSTGNAYGAGSAVFDFGGGWRTSAQVYGGTEFDLNFSTYVSPADTTAPVTTDDVPSGWRSSPVSATLTATDAGSGVAHTYYTTDGTTPTTASNIYDPLAPPLLTDGEYVAYFSVDQVGNTETVKTSATAKVDTTAPTTTDDVPSAWQSAPVTVTLSAADAGSGVAATYYTTDGTTPTTSSSAYDASSKPVLHDGERIRYFSVDEVGNSEAVQSSPAAHVDTTAPSTTDDVPSGWQSAPVSVTLSADDAGSGVAATYYTTDGTTPTTTSSEYDPNSKPVLHDGESIAYFSVDTAGNAEPVQTSRAAKVDTTAPTITASATQADGAAYHSGDWTNQAVTVHYECSDQAGGSGVPAGACPQDTVVSDETSAAGVDVSRSVSDAAGNSATSDVVNVRIDRTSPTVAFTGAAASYTVDQTITIACSASDALSGLAGSDCSGAGLSGVPAASLTPGDHTLSASVRDAAGNTGSASVTFTVVDSAAALSDLVASYSTDPAVASSLGSKLDSIAAASAGANGNAKAGKVQAFVHQVDAQTGKALTAAQAATLLRLAAAL